MPVDLKSHLILYVDDEWANRAVFETTFRDRFQVRVAASGEEALGVFEAGEVAVLVADQRMPGMSGNELLARARERSPATIRMVVTGYSDLSLILAAVNDGLVARYVIKPWERGELESALEWCVEAYAESLARSGLHLRLLAAERLISVGNIAAAILHDLGNVVSRVQHDATRLGQLAPGARVLLEHTRTAPAGERAQAEELARELGAIAAELNDDLRMITNLIGGVKRVLRPTSEERGSADPVPAIRYALDVFRHDARGATLTYEGPPYVPRVAMGTTELTQVLLNLVSNAVRALPKSGGALKSGRTGRIAVKASTDARNVVFSVVDDGAGMPEEVRAQAGTLFFTTREDGTGLGLSNCKRLVGMAGGNIEIQSEPGRGTTVSFTVPLA